MIRESLHVSQIELPAGVKVLTSSDATIVTITHGSKAEAAPASEEAATEEAAAEESAE